MVRVTVKDVDAEATEINDNLVCTDARFNQIVQIVHIEGTVMLLQGAFVEKWPVGDMGAGYWYVVFTEHHGYFVYHSDEVTVYQFIPVPIEIISNAGDSG